MLTHVLGMLSTAAVKHGSVRWVPTQTRPTGKTAGTGAAFAAYNYIHKSNSSISNNRMSGSYYFFNRGCVCVACSNDCHNDGHKRLGESELHVCLVGRCLP